MGSPVTIYGQIVIPVDSGVDAIRLTTTGARIHVDTHASSYIYGDGTGYVSSPVGFRGGDLLTINGVIRNDTSVKLTFTSYENNGATASPFVFNTANTLNTFGAKIASFKNNGSEKFGIGYDGSLNFPSLLFAVNGSGCSSNVFTGWGTSAILLKPGGSQTDGATTVAVTIDTYATYSTSGAKLVSIRNNTVEKAYIDKDGGFVSGSSLGFTSSNSPGQGLGFAGTNTSVKAGAAGSTVYLSDQSVNMLAIDVASGADFTGLGNGAVIRLKSPDGTIYKLSIANGGTVNITT